jgi:tRNA pseudouridine55 synthase
VAPAAPASTGAAAASWSGLLFVDKPAGVTSHDVIDRVRRRHREKSAGHLGTLDPGASGLLVVAVGAATRCASVWQSGEKLYRAKLRLGVTTSTQDLSGEVIRTRDVNVDEAAVRSAALELTGEIEQIPPMVSALKVGGQRLYRLARRGIEVERTPRRVNVSEWNWLGFDLPTATFEVRCSGGTYVRTLIHDLGERLGTGAALETLRRLRSEPFGLERSVTLRDLDLESPGAVRERAGLGLDRALDVLPAVTLDPAGAAEIGFGRAVELDAAAAGAAPLEAGSRSIAIRGPDGGVLALGELVPASPGRVRVAPHLVFPWAVREGLA